MSSFWNLVCLLSDTSIFLWNPAGAMADDQDAVLSKRRRIGFNKRKGAFVFPATICGRCIMRNCYRADNPLYYHSYLGLDNLLTAQKLMSAPDNATDSSSSSSSSSSSLSSSSSSSSSAAAPAPAPAAGTGASLCPHMRTLEQPGIETRHVHANTTASDVAAALETSNRSGAHDEHLFIVIHQAFEVSSPFGCYEGIRIALTGLNFVLSSNQLWFKQVLWEIGDAQRLLNSEYVQERSVAVVISRLTRVVEIFRLLVEQFTILETMTPLGEKGCAHLTFTRL